MSEDLRLVVIASEGRVVTFFETDRTEFPEICTLDRDRTFIRQYQGDLAQLVGEPIDLPGVIYVESKPWRVGTKTINKPSERVRRLKSALVIPFPVRPA
ncbi:hypothetical protein ABC347_10800 [Sphingomonas sp. 1P06PA]|uniref:hypothetical protein n=1 Tax=Sphingomonas sp. 1P06PA TaxID=554121 RepID=UPI0039A6A908